MTARWLGLGILTLAIGCGGATPRSGGNSGSNGGGNSGGASSGNGNGNGSGSGNGNGSTGTGSGTGSGGSSGSDGGSGDTGQPGPPTADFDPTYTGFDGTHSFIVPLSTNLTGTITWTVSDPTLATVVTIPPAKVPPDDADPAIQWAMITATKAGSGTITGTSGGMTVTAKLNVTGYTAAQWTAGQKRWTTAPAGLIACTTCHTGTNAIDNTPTWTAEFSDAELTGMFTLGQYPDGTPLNAPNHKFTLSDAEKSGILAYLRSLPPKGF